MNRMMLTMAAVMTVSAAACAQNRGEKRMQTDNKALVVYFSATGTTPGQPERLRRPQAALCMRLFRNKRIPPTILTGATGSRAAPSR